MPTQTYDPDADKKHSPVDDHPEHVKDRAEQAPYDDAFSSLVDNYNNDEFSDIVDQNFDHRTDEPLDNQETAAADSTAGGAATNDEEKDDTVGKGYVASAKKKGKGAIAKLSNSKKFLVFGTAGVGAGLIAGIIVLFLIASSLKLPNVAQNIVGYQFARLSRTFSQAGDKITDESFVKIVTKKLAQTELGQAAKQKLQDTKDKINDIHDQATGLKDGTIDKIKGIPGAAQFLILNDTYNPFQVQKNLEEYGLTYGTDGNGRPFITIAGKAAEDLHFDPQSFILGPPSKSIGRFIPGFSEYLTARTNVRFFNDDLFRLALRKAYNNSLRLNNVPTLVRGIAMNSILKRIGINRAGLIINNFRNARIRKEWDPRIDQWDKELDEYYSKQTAVTTAVPDSGPSGDAAQQAANDQEAAKQAAAADATGKASADLRGNDSTGIADKAAKDIGEAAAHGSATGAMTRFIAGPIYNAAYLACVFDEGANSGDNNKVIDANNDANEKSFVFLTSASDQLKRGPLSSDQLTAFDNAQTAMNDKLGSDEQYSVPLLRARGASYDTSTEQAAQSTVYGFQPPEKAVNNSLFWDFMKSVEGSCSVISSAWTAGGVALINLAALVATFIPSGGGSVGGEAGVEAASQSVLKVTLTKASEALVKQISKNFGRQAGLKLAAKNAVSKSYKLFKQIVKNGVVVVGTESLGSMMAAYHVPSLNHTGYETGNTFIGQADAGGNATAQEQMRIMLFGRPLLKSEVCATNVLDSTYQQTALSSQSAYQRYLATTNPQSLLSRTAIAVHDNLTGSLGKPLASLATIIGNPLGWLSSVFGYRAFADAASNCDSSTAFYGNMQIGWSEDEVALTDSNDSYNPDENMAILARSGKADAIAQKYGACFGYSYTGGSDDSIAADPNATVGYMLTGGSGGQQLVTRDTLGNVINDDSAKCSPEYLSYNSKDTGLAADNVTDSSGQFMSPQRNDLIFRWRLAMKYTNVQNQLIAIQRAGGTSST